MLDPGHHPTHVPHKAHSQDRRRRRRADYGGSMHRRFSGIAPALIECAFFLSAFSPLIVFPTASVRTALMVRLRTAKRATQVAPIRIARIREEKNPTVPAPDQVSAQPGLLTQ